MKPNPYFAALQKSYLFIDIARRVSAFTEANPNADVIRLGIGDVTRPLAAPVVAALEAASREMGSADTFRGYGPDTGYPFLKEAVRGYYAKRGVRLDADEIFISDGCKSDCGNIGELFAADNTVLIPNPVYPVYVDSNLMAGRPIVYAEATRENGFLPLPDRGVKADIIYICSPNNPTGAAYTQHQLAQWVDYARGNDAVILFDAAYECFVQTPDVPHSIYEVPGAEDCAIELCSLSKTAGFTGVRCGYTVIPKALVRGAEQLNALWARRQGTKFNEVSYIIQRGAEAVFTEAGMAACMENVAYYKKNTAVLSAALAQAGIWHSGGQNSPYIWMQCPGGMKSWDFFDMLLDKAHVVGTPGAGFGQNGEGFFRLTGFGNAARTAEAAERLVKLLG